jgi:hypothetical protein
MAFGLPFLKSSEERARVFKAKPSQRERRTGARFLRLSTAAGDDRLGEPSQPFDAALDRAQRNRNRPGNMASLEAVVAPHVHNGHGVLRGKADEMIERDAERGILQFLISVTALGRRRRRGGGRRGAVSPTAP